MDLAKFIRLQLWPTYPNVLFPHLSKINKVIPKRTFFKFDLNQSLQCNTMTIDDDRTVATMNRLIKLAVTVRIMIHDDNQ